MGTLILDEDADVIIDVETSVGQDAISAGSIHSQIVVSGGEAAAPFVPNPTIFQDVSRTSVALSAEGEGAAIDIDLLPKGRGGTLNTNRLFVNAKTFGQRNNLCGATILTNAPDIEEANNIPHGADFGPAAAAVYGIGGGEGVGNYPDIDQAGLFIRPYGTRDVPLAVTSYTATTVVLAEPLPEDHDLQLTSTLQTASTPWHRGVLTGISTDRRTLTVYGWSLDKGAESGPYTFETPAGSPSIYLNPYTKGFGVNVAMELHGPIYKRVRDVPDQSAADGRLAWFGPGDVFIPYSGDQHLQEATKPTNAGSNATLHEISPENFQDNMFVGEVSVVNTKGLIDYAGTTYINDPVTGESFNLEGIRGCKNFTAGFDVVQLGSYVDTTTGEARRSYGGFAVRARGQFVTGYEALECRDYGFRVQRGHTSPDIAGFAYEAGNQLNTKTAFLVACAKDPRWKVDGLGNMQIGSKTVAYGGNSVQWFVSARAEPDALMTVTKAPTAPDVPGVANGDIAWTASYHEFKTGDGSLQFRVGNGYGATSHLRAEGSTAASPTIRAEGAAADVDIRITPKGEGVLNLDFVKAGYSATNAANFSPDRIIEIKTPFGVFYIPAALNPW